MSAVAGRSEKPVMYDAERENGARKVDDSTPARWQKGKTVMK